MDTSDYGENNIEFVKNSDRATCFFTQGRFITRIKKMAEQYPEECQIVGTNKNGSIVAHIPVKWIHISNYSREMSDEQRKAAADRMRELHKTNNSN